MRIRACITKSLLIFKNWIINQNAQLNFFQLNVLIILTCAVALFINDNKPITSNLKQ